MTTPAAFVLARPAAAPTSSIEAAANLANAAMSSSSAARPPATGCNLQGKTRIGGRTARVWATGWHAGRRYRDLMSPLESLASSAAATSEPIIEITDAALAKLKELRDEEADADQLGLRVEIASLPGEDFRYEL